jgi:type II secretory pathway pseudopilin PulG
MRFYKSKIVFKKFALIEIILALTILSITFTVILTALQKNTKNASIAYGYMNASMLFYSLYNRILLDNSQFKEGVSRGDFGNKFSGYSWRVDVNDDTKSSSDNDVNFKVIDIEIFFTSGGQKRSMFMKTMKLETKQKKDESKGEGETQEKTSDDKTE